jgi:hypothetical protein
MRLTTPIIFPTVTIHIVAITFMVIGTTTRRRSARGATKRKSLFLSRRYEKPHAGSRPAFTDAKA